MKLLAVQGFTPSLSDMTPTPIVATITLTGTPSIKNKINGHGFCYDGFTLTVTNITSPSAGATISDPGPYNTTFLASALKSKGLDVGGKFPLRQDDKTAIINATPKIPNSPNPIDYPVSFKIQITNAGQTKVLSN